MRTTLPKLLLLVAIVIVVTLEARTVLAFFGVEVTIAAMAVVGAVTILAILLWAVVPFHDPRRK